jgi:hypothetical protein
MWEKFFFSWFLVWLPLVFSGGIIFLVILNNTDYKKPNFLVFNNKKLVIIFLLGSVFFKIFLSVLQYLVWQNSSFAHFFLPPFTPITYFLKYSFFHFWLSGVLTLISGSLLFFVFKIFKKYRHSAVNNQELSLIFLSGLILSWPKIIVFILFLFCFSFLFLIINLVIKKKAIASIKWPVILALVASFFFGGYLINLLSLSVLII